MLIPKIEFFYLRRELIARNLVVLYHVQVTSDS